MREKKLKIIIGDRDLLVVAGIRAAIMPQYIYYFNNYLNSFISPVSSILS